MTGNGSSHGSEEDACVGSRTHEGKGAAGGCRSGVRWRRRCRGRAGREGPGGGRGRTGRLEALELLPAEAHGLKLEAVHADGAEEVDVVGHQIHPWSGGTGDVGIAR